MYDMFLSILFTDVSFSTRSGTDGQPSHCSKGVAGLEQSDSEVSDETTKLLPNLTLNRKSHKGNLIITAKYRLTTGG